MRNMVGDMGYGNRDGLVTVLNHSWPYITIILYIYTVFGISMIS